MITYVNEAENKTLPKKYLRCFYKEFHAQMALKNNIISLEQEFKLGNNVVKFSKTDKGVIKLTKV